MKYLYFVRLVGASSRRCCSISCPRRLPNRTNIHWLFLWRQPMFVQPVLSLSFPCIHGAAAARTHAHAPSHAHARLCPAVFVCCCCPIHAYPFRSHCYYLLSSVGSFLNYSTVPTSVCVQILDNRRSHVFSSFPYRGSLPSLLSPSSFIDCIMDLKISRK